jgi:flagella basal body P-ring formation protein FlgA
MISIPPLIYVEYKALSNNEGMAEIQKDIIVQLIKLNKQEETVVIENLPEQEKSQKDCILSAKCLQCTVLDDSQFEIITSSIKKSTNNFSAEISFDLINASEKKVTWKVELTEKKIIYFIAAKQNIIPNTILSQKDLDVVSCTTAETKCFPKFPFLNSKDALSQLMIYGNKKSSNSIRIGQEVDPKLLSQEILIRSNEKVRITYSPNNSLTVQTFGKSLSNGGRGEIIRVQISDWFDKGAASRPTGIIEGTVIAPGEVEYAAN